MPKNSDVLIVGLADDGETQVFVGADEIGKSYGKKYGDMRELALALGGSSKAGSTVVLPMIDSTRTIVVGLGAHEATPESLRRAAGAGVRCAAGLAKDQPLSVAIDFDIDDPELIIGAVEGALLGAYSFAKVSSKESKKTIQSIALISSNTKSEAKEAVDYATITAGAVWLCRDWVNTPANFLYPETFASDAKTMAKAAKIDIEIVDHVELEKKGYGGLTMVGKGSTNKPRLVRLSYAPKGATFHLVLVGKGVTFDTGGLNLKPADGMYTMKCDMAGAATVLAATKAIAELGLKIKVTTYAAMAENMPSADAYRPSDVLTIYGGKTVENANCDAEGRLVMADALARANEDKADLIVDCATLTGACVVALGTKCAGLMASDDKTADSILDAAEAAGEKFWQLPIPEDAAEQLESKVADLKSSGGRWGGAMTAAAFLHEFVDEQTPWAHLDIAGPAYNEAAAYGHVSLGGSGHGVRTIVALADYLQQ